MKILCILLISVMMAGCRTVAILYEPNEDGVLIMKGMMELRGVGKNEADFKDKKIKNDSGFKMPELPKIEFDN